MTTNERLTTAFATITAWMKKHRASKLASNLARGAAPAKLDDAEEELGFAIPAELRELWSLHDGQKEELNGFVEAMDLYGVEQAVAEREGILLFVELLREDEDEREEAGVSDEEASSDFWLPLAGRDSDAIVVSAVSGRVFSCGKDSPPLHLLADSVVAWLERYAARVAAGDFTVEEGFGDYYLEERDREAEKRAADEKKRQKELERYRKVTPVLEQLTAALARGDQPECRDLMKRAGMEKDGAELPKAVELLFAANQTPQFVADSIRLVLNKVALTPAQWELVADGGKRAGNNALHDIALQRARG